MKAIVIWSTFQSINNFILQNWGACVDIVFGHVSEKLMKLGSAARKIVINR